MKNILLLENYYRLKTYIGDTATVVHEYFPGYLSGAVAVEKVSNDGYTFGFADFEREESELVQDYR
jgi:hypothetical protein